MITKLINKMFGEKPACRQGRGELSSFRFVREAIAMKNILRNKRTQIFLAVLIIFTFHLQIFTQSAFARGSGGGDLSEFKTEKFITSVGIGLVSSVAGNVISSGISDMFTTGGSFAAGATNAIGNYGSSLGSWASSYNSMAALSQLGSAISMTGQQQGWDVSTTTFVSSVAQGVVGGGLNPLSTLGVGGISNSTLKAMGVGAISGVTEGAILANNIDSNGRVKPWVSAGANLAGAFVGGIASASIAAVIPEKGPEMQRSPSPSYQDYVKSGEPTFKTGSEGLVPEGVYNRIAAHNTTRKIDSTWPVMVKTSTPKLTYHKANFGQALTHGAVKAFSAIPSSAVSMGVSSITKDMDKQDAFMVRQAFSGAYPIVGAAYGNVIRDPVFEKIGLQNYTGSNSLEGNAKIKIDNRVKMVPIPGN